MDKKKSFISLTILLMLIATIACDISFAGDQSEEDAGRQLTMVALQQTQTAMAKPPEPEDAPPPEPSEPEDDADDDDDQPASNENCYYSKWTGAETILDGTKFDPGDSFVKSWTLRNEGTCEWTTDFRMVFEDGDQMGGPNSVYLTHNVKTGDTYTVEIPMTAPSSDGDYTDRVQVTWDAAGGATSYEVYRATSAGGAKTKIGTPSSTSFDDTGIVVGTTYTYWVKACNTWVCSDYSGADDGHAGLAAPQLIYPTDGSVVKDWKPPFEWNASSGAIEYKLQVDDDSDFSSPLIDITTGGTSYTPTSPLADGTYSWRVRASDGAGTWSNYSDVWVVTVDVFKIYLPIILKP